MKDKIMQQIKKRNYAASKQKTVHEQRKEIMHK